MKLILTSLISASLAFGAFNVSAQSLKLGHYVSPADFRGQTAQKFADILTSQDGNKFDIKVYPNESLVKGRDALQATARGTVDLYSVFAGYITGSIGLMKIFTIPFPSESYTDRKLMEFANDPEVVEILDKSLNKNNVKLLGFINSTGTTTGFFRDELKNIDDFKGLKIRGVGGYSDLALEDLGASIVFMSAAEQFLQLETGGVDAVVTTESSFVNQDLAAVAPYMLGDSVIRGPYAFIMNKKKWDRLNDEQKQALSTAVADTIAWSSDNFEEDADAIHAKLKEKVKGTYYFSEDEMVKIDAIKDQALDMFVEEYGPDAAKLAEIYRKYQ